jgi:hypothetical protein
MVKGGPIEVAHDAHIRSAKVKRDLRIEHVAHARVLQHKKAVDIAKDLNISVNTLNNWMVRHRNQLDAAMAAKIEEVKQMRASAALEIRAGLSDNVGDALKVVKDVLAGTSDKAAKDAARAKVAFGVIDHVDPPSRGKTTVNLNVFSEKATRLLQSVAGQDLTPRKPLPRPRDIESEAELVEEEED